MVALPRFVARLPSPGREIEASDRAQALECLQATWASVRAVCEAGCVQGVGMKRHTWVGVDCMQGFGWFVARLPPMKLKGFQPLQAK